MAVHGKPTVSFFTSPSWDLDTLGKECIPIKTGAQVKNIVFTMSTLPQTSFTLNLDTDFQKVHMKHQPILRGESRMTLSFVRYFRGAPLP